MPQNGALVMSEEFSIVPSFSNTTRVMFRLFDSGNKYPSNVLLLCRPRNSAKIVFLANLM